jgi:hypothetical protein
MDRYAVNNDDDNERIIERILFEICPFIPPFNGGALYDIN